MQRAERVASSDDPRRIAACAAAGTCIRSAHERSSSNQELVAPKNVANVEVSSECIHRVGRRFDLVYPQRDRALDDEFDGLYRSAAASR